METIVWDVRVALRSLRRRPAFTVVAVLTMALGVGTTTAMFGVVNAVLFRPLPYQDPERLVMVREVHAGQGRVEQASALTLRDWRERSRSFSALAAWIQEERALIGGGEPEAVEVLRVSPSFFTAFGVAPAMGRAFSPDEETTGRDRVVVLGHAIWQRRFGGDPAVLGRSIILDDVAHTVVGVMPRDFRFPSDGVALAVPLAHQPHELRSRQKRMFDVAARLAPGVTLVQAQGEMRRVALDLARAYPQSNEGWTAEVRSMGDTVREPARGLLMLFGAVGLVLLIACANVASLLLARGESRRRELAVRAALGASRTRLVRELFLEALAIAALGGALGALLAWGALRSLLVVAPVALPWWGDVGVDGWVLAFAVIASTLSALLAGLVPAAQLTARSAGSVAELSERATDAPGSRRMRSVLVGAEVALAFVLLAGAALLVQSLREVTRVDPGFDPTGRLVAAIRLVESRYESDQRQTAFFETLLERLRAMPGVIGAGAVTTLPLSRGGIDHDIEFTVPGDAAVPAGVPRQTDFRAASAGYFESLGIPVRAGRTFGTADHGEAPPVMVVNETMARLAFGDRAPLGRRIGLGDRGPGYEVVGVVADVHHRGLDEPARPEVYVPLSQWPSYGEVQVVVRTAGNPSALAPALKDAVFAIDPQQPVASIAPLPELVVGSTAAYRFRTLVLGAFSLLGVLLAAVGIYGLTSNMVARRTREMGIRMALGARAGDVIRLVAREGLVPVCVGLAVGVAGALALTRFIAAFLYGVGARDPVSFATTAAVLLATAAAALYVPARRATRIDPVRVMKE